MAGVVDPMYKMTCSRKAHSGSSTLRRKAAVGLLLALAFPVTYLTQAQAVVQPQPQSQPPQEPQQDKILLRTGVVTVHQVMNEGLANSPRLEQARSQIPVAKAALKQATVFPNPGVMTDLQVQFTYKYGATIQFEAPWLILFRLIAARKQVEQADLELSRVLWNYRGQARRLYAELIMASELANTQDDLVALTKRLQLNAQQRFENGDVPRLDVHRAKLAVIQAELDAEQAHILIDRSREQLNILIGRTADSPMNLPALRHEQSTADTSGLLPDLTRELPPRQKLIQEAYQSRYELKVARQAADVARAQLNVARADNFPRGLVNAGLMVEDVTIEGSLRRKTPYVQAQVFLPIFDRQQGRIARSKADINQWNKTEISQKNIIDSEVALAYRRVEMARAKIRRYLQQAIPTSEQLTASADLGYKMGHTDINAVLDVQQRNILLRTQYLQSVLEYQLALNDLEQAVGHPLL